MKGTRILLFLVEHYTIKMDIIKNNSFTYKYVKPYQIFYKKLIFLLN